MAKTKLKSTKIHDTRADHVLDIVTGAILVFLCLIVAYPLIYVISASFSSSRALEAGLVVLWPVEPCLQAYDFVLNYKAVWVGYRNSIFYTGVDLVFQTFCTIVVAYPLSRRYFQGRSFTTWYIYIITRFGAGLIPCYILKCNLGLYDNIWAILLSGNISVSHMLMLRTAIKSNVPEDLLDAARIDGANHFYTVLNIVMPLTKATLSVLALYAMVGSWNEYFTAMIYLRNKDLFPLQLVLRPIMTAASTAAQMSETGNMPPLYQQMADQGLENVRYALIIISSVPAIAAYFVVQKAFKGGVMLGSLKG
ncbi:MAG: carbohydrate ABC transporter permease [Oscillospiraceae bacterium]|nr:carbohydrate ABC transporter permease [Oscillospiraceae bacterium]